MENEKISLHEKMNRFIRGILVPMIMCVGVLLANILFFSLQYTKVSRNVRASSAFNLEFKDALDLKMYHYMVGSKEQKTLPISDVDFAIDLATSLQKTTRRRESQRCIKDLLDYSVNLKRRMYQMQATNNYDERKQQLENNIYVLTGLIQERMMNYIYYEAGYLSEVEQALERNMKITTLLIMAAIIFVILVVADRSIHFSWSITDPIRKMCENLAQVSRGEFHIRGVQTHDTEMEEMNVGILRMARQIDHLLEEVKEEEKRKNQIQLQLLQEQINPHFLYNTLDTIVWLVEAGDQQKAVKMLTDLSGFFRTTLSKGKDIIRLSEEIEHTRNYLEIQKVRYQDIMDYTIELPKELEDVYLPKLTLQPLAENALYHGVKEKRGKSQIKIQCEEKDGYVQLVVEDTGKGIEPERLKELQDALENGKRVGFGMSAVHERIRLFCGENCGLKIESQFGEYTSVQVRLRKISQLV